MRSHRALVPKPEDGSAPRGTRPALSSRAASSRSEAHLKVACNTCRSRKQRCDGIRPSCRYCAKRGKSCEYDTAPGQTRAAALRDRQQADKASLLEIFWKLQTTSAQDAQSFLEHIRSSGPVDIPALQKWFKQRSPSDQQNEHQDEPPGSKERPSGDSSTLTGCAPGGLETRVADQPQDQKPQPMDLEASHPSIQQQPWSASLTIASVKSAVDVFLQTAGILFHVFSRPEADALYASLLAQPHYDDDTSFLDVLRENQTPQCHAQLAELCGMAAVGAVYSRLPSNEAPPPPEMAGFLYSTTKLVLDSAVDANPLRAMKVCALLAMYNIVVKATVAFAYVELGLGLGRSHGLHTAHCPPNMQQAAFLDYRRVWRSLLLFSGWLSASLGHISAEDAPGYHLPEEDSSVLTGHVIQGQLVKATIIKAAIIRTMGDQRLADDETIERFRKALRTFHEQMPPTVAIDSLFNVLQPAPLRPSIFYLHLFYLSAIQLLYRRVIGNCSIDLQSEPATAAIREGLMAAKMTARILALMRLEGAIVQLCWMCIYLSYCSGVIILQSVVQKVLTQPTATTWTADLALVDTCLQTLKFCAQVDKVALEFESLLSSYAAILKAAMAGSMASVALENPDEDISIEYLFHIPNGTTPLHKAARDLLLLIHKPFTKSLEIGPEARQPQLNLDATLINWAEAAAGTPQEWAWELQQCIILQDGDDIAAKNESPVFETLSRISLGCFIPNAGNVPWPTWTPDYY